MKTKFNGPVLILPDWKFSQPDARVPHRRRIIAHYKVPGIRLEYFVCENHKRTLFWVKAVGPGIAGDFCRVSHTVSTTSKDLAALWVQAVTAGNVRIE